MSLPPTVAGSARPTKSQEKSESPGVVCVCLFMNSRKNSETNGHMKKHRLNEHRPWKFR